MEVTEDTMVWFRGKQLSLGDAQRELSKEELQEVEVEREDGTRVRPFRFCEVDPVVGHDEHGILSI